MLETPTITPTALAPLASVLDTMRAADPRLVRLVYALAVAFVFMSALAVPMACTSVGQHVNAALDDATLIMFAMLPVLYLSGRHCQN